MRKCACCLAEKEESAFKRGGGNSDTCAGCIPIVNAIRLINSLFRQSLIDHETLVEKVEYQLSKVGRTGGIRYGPLD